ncbi:MAG: alpha-D-glucose phosphate-specific phosphoglucomutase [Verrucomicrobia subdivision 3 bacterium]|nr:phosphoglucomutase (alpha-D-glucose-1,6-bisphosphate-dependent) [Verrucomicrobiota bacterium]MCC6819275.1 alpha-D-glucose phosphate-specific phosphoglucomutase [Limisphaerales bacterium]
MALSPLAGKPAPANLLIDVAKLERDYYQRAPDLADANQLVSFGTSGHRGTPFNGTFTEAHILATTQAICEYRKGKGIGGPLFMGKDPHAISAAAQRTALEVLAANGVETFLQRDDGFTPTPSISHAILTHNRGRADGLSDGIVITPSHNPPEDGGFKYNPPNGGPADTDITGWVQNRANELLRGGNQAVRRLTYESALKARHTHQHDFITPYVNTLGEVIDMDAIRAAGVRIGIDPLGGAALPYWQPVKERYGLDLTVVNTKVDPQFGFMTVDHDGKIRMDCSSPYAMAGLVQLKNQFSVAFGTDPDADRHGIVTPSAGLLNPNHYLAVAINYLLTHRPQWPTSASVGKTLVSSSIIDRVVASRGRKLNEVPVGFKWFAPGLADGTVCFGGEESAGASFLRRDGRVWTTDKDGLILGLLAAEICATTGNDPAQHYADLTAQFGAPSYKRIDAPATPDQKKAFKKLTPAAVTASTLAGDPITAKLTRAPGNNADIGGLKVVTQNGWFAARPSGTENIYKVYAESFKGAAPLDQIIDEAQQIVTAALR